MKLCIARRNLVDFLAETYPIAFDQLHNHTLKKPTGKNKMT
jgi:hypothetical protein